MTFVSGFLVTKATKTHKEHKDYIHLSFTSFHPPGLSIDE